MFSVLTLNLNGQRDRWLGRRELLLAEILRELPDFIAFQDVSVSGRQVNWLARQLNARWGTHLYHWIQVGRGGWFGGFSDGVAILSRFPILWHERIDLGHGMIGGLANIELPLGWTMDFVSVRLLFGERLSDIRYEQGMALLSMLTAPGRSTQQIVVGSFNDGADSRVIRRMKQNYHSAFESVHGCEPIATFPTALVQLDPHWTACLDYIFLSTAVSVSEIRLFGQKGHPDDPDLFMSSHVGLLTRIQFPRIED